jgi:hypothetical protein
MFLLLMLCAAFASSRSRNISPDRLSRLEGHPGFVEDKHLTRISRIKHTDYTDRKQSERSADTRFCGTAGGLQMREAAATLRVILPFSLAASISSHGTRCLFYSYTGTKCLVYIYGWGTRSGNAASLLSHQKRSLRQQANPRVRSHHHYSGIGSAPPHSAIITPAPAPRSCIASARPCSRR